MKNKKLQVELLKIRRQLAFKNIPVPVKLFLSFSFVFSVMLFLSFITFTNYKKDKEFSTLTVIQQMDSQTINKIDDYIDDLKSITKLPLLKSDNFDSGNNFIKELDNFNKTNVLNLTFQKLIEQLSYNIFNYKSNVHSVFVFNLKGNNDYKMKGSSLYKQYNLVNEAWFKQSVEAFGKPIVIETFKLPNVADVNKKSVYVFSVSRGIVSVEDSEVIGVILVNNKIDFLSNACKKAIMVPGQRILILGKNSEIVYDTLDSNISKRLDASISNVVSLGTDSTSNIKIDGVEFLVDYKTSNVTGWKLVNILPVNELNKNINQMGKTTVIITFILLFISFLMLLFISRQVVKPLKKLVLLMKLFEKGDFGVKVKLKSRDEVGQLSKSFNSMTRKIKKLINEVYIDKLKQKELELQMLQNQINPHFLYNTLESIHMMAEINQDMETSKMTRALGSFLRYSITSCYEMVTVGAELENLQNYILLHEVRFEDIFDISIDVDKTLYNCKIIRLILQPLVENAIYHGLSSRESGGTIHIIGYREADKIIFEVSDNGMGMDETKIKKLNDYINDLNDYFKSIGLKNVNKRIKLQYGNEYGAEIFSKVGVGTTVKVTVPNTSEIV